LTGFGVYRKIKKRRGFDEKFRYGSEYKGGGTP